jgi:nucleolar GTP-binding protein
MFEKIPDILPAEKLLDSSFKKANKVQITDMNAYFKKKKTIIAKTESFSTIIISTLEQYVKNFPSIDNLPSFYVELLDIKIKVDNLKKSLGAVDWARKACRSIYSKQSRSLIKSKNIDFLIKKQHEIYGRISSVIKQINKELKILSEATIFIKSLPEIKDIFTVVIVGYPNVGKSSILRCLSAAKPEIAQYPFTTKEIFIGHVEIKEKYIKKSLQIIDTPGLLDSPISEKNEIEKQAIAALTHLADVIVFIIDPSETCGYVLEDQLNLLSSIKKMFSDASFIVVENKVDLKNTKSDYLKISCETREGIDLLMKEIISLYKKVE